MDAIVKWRWARPADAEPFWEDVQQDFRAVGYEGEPPPLPEQVEPQPFPAEVARFWAETATRRHQFQVGYRTDDYVAILATQSDRRVRPGAQRRLPGPGAAPA